MSAVYRTECCLYIVPVGGDGGRGRLRYTVPGCASSPTTDYYDFRQKEDCGLALPRVCSSANTVNSTRNGHGSTSTTYMDTEEQAPVRGLCTFGLVMRTRLLLAACALSCHVPSRMRGSTSLAYSSRACAWKTTHLRGSLWWRRRAEVDCARASKLARRAARDSQLLVEVRGLQAEADALVAEEVVRQLRVHRLEHGGDGA